jgi:hypothetical protein
MSGDTRSTIAAACLLSGIALGGVLAPPRCKTQRAKPPEVFATPIWCRSYALDGRGQPFAFNHRVEDTKSIVEAYGALYQTECLKGE